MHMVSTIMRTTTTLIPRFTKVLSSHLVKIGKFVSQLIRASDVLGMKLDSRVANLSF